MGTSGNRDCQRASRSALKDFTDDALTISADSLFQNGTVRMVKANWRRTRSSCSNASWLENEMGSTSLSYQSGFLHYFHKKRLFKVNKIH